MGRRPRGLCSVCGTWQCGRWDGDTVTIGAHGAVGFRCPGSGSEASHESLDSSPRPTQVLSQPDLAYFPLGDAKPPAWVLADRPTPSMLVRWAARARSQPRP